MNGRVQVENSLALDHCFGTDGVVTGRKGGKLDIGAQLGEQVGDPAHAFVKVDDESSLGAPSSDPSFALLRIPAAGACGAAGGFDVQVQVDSGRLHAGVVGDNAGEIVAHAQRGGEMDGVERS